MGRYFKEYSEFLAEIFTGKVQKIPVNVGLSCPNRDGTLGRGGCIYCNNASFSPVGLNAWQSLEEQINAGREFFRRKYKDMRFLVYFQSYTSTHGQMDRLMDLYRRAAATEGTVGIIIGTRPDCVPDELLNVLSELNRECKVLMEYGAESAHNRTLELINRCHSWEQTVDAVKRSHEAGLKVGLHFIMGLPGEDEKMMLETVDAACALSPEVLKFHQLQVIKGTPLARMYESGNADITLFTPESYSQLCMKIISRVPAHIAIDRFVAQAPSDMVIAPKWGMKNYQFAQMLENKLKEYYKEASKDLT
ncbi:MAG: TIGR01212 family radical SAM protein [Muribaculaceae bacterium]|nr:TIGR01212 family radical SAM protein [Muribaculaceae bacterium]